MEDKYMQLQLNFEKTLAHTQRNETFPLAEGAQDVLARYVAAAPTNVVQMKDMREQRERIKRIEEEHMLMERIRAQIEHLQA